MYLKDSELTQFFDWIYTEICEEVKRPGTTICRDLLVALVHHFEKQHRTISDESKIEFMVFNIVEEFMDRPFETALSNYNMIPEHNRFSQTDMLLLLPVFTLSKMFSAKQNKRRIKVRYKFRSLNSIAHALKK